MAVCVDKNHLQKPDFSKIQKSYPGDPNATCDKKRQGMTNQLMTAKQHDILSAREISFQKS